MHSGKVTRCEHRGGILHEIGIVFDKEIRLREYLPPDSNDLVHSHENVNAETLETNILFVSDDVDFGALVRQLLLSTKIKYGFEKDAEGAVENASQFSIIAVHHDTITREGPTTVALLREHGFLNPIVLLGVPESEAEEHIMHACGADMVIPWPCEGKTFLCGIAEYILNAWTHESLATIRSCLGPGIKQALTSHLAVLSVKLDQAVRVEDRDQSRSTLVLIRQVALILESHALAGTAANLSARLKDDEPFGSLKDELDEIVSVCQLNANKRAA